MKVWDKNRKALWIGFLAIFILVGCNSAVAERQPESAAVLTLTGDVQNGEQLFNAATHGDANLASCALCHSLEEGKKQTGPSLFGVGTRAETAVSGQSAEQYLYASIVNPNELVVGDFYSNVMSSQYADVLSDQDIADLIAYLLTLEE